PLIGILAIAAILPQLLSTSPYYLRLITFCFFYIALASSWNIVGGIAGQPFLGMSAPFGVGGYVTMILARYLKMPPLFGMWIGGAFSVIIALLLTPLLKLRVDLFAIGSLSVPIIFMLYFYTTEAFGSCNGISMPPDSFYNETLIAYIFLLLALSAVLVNYKIINSDIGVMMRAIANNPELATASGINIFYLKFLALLISSFFIGVLGGMYSYYMLSVLPETAFDIFWAIQTMLMCIIGGMGTFLGPVIGAPLIYLITTFIGTVFLGVQRLIVGIFLVLLVLFFPEGLPLANMLMSMFARKTGGEQNR
ncbi:MAG: branched-chain amino acid ABC transporter permease, partial [Nitrososphaerota archaeon]